MKNYFKNQGDFNHLPGPRKELTREEFLSHLLFEQVLETERRQILDAGYICEVKIFHLAGFAIAVQGLPGVDQQRFWKLGCDHTAMREEPAGSCRVRRICTDCGYVEEVDSSD